MSNELEKIKDETIDIKKYLFLIIHYWWWFALTLSISLSIAYLVNRYSEKLFTVQCSIIIGENETQAGSIESLLEDLTRTRTRRSRGKLTNEITVLKSYKLSRKTIENLPDFNVSYVEVGRRNIAKERLYKNSPFKVVPDSGYNRSGYPIYINLIDEESYLLKINDDYEITRKLKFGEKFKNNDFSFSIVKGDSSILDMLNLTNKYYFAFNNINVLANQYKNKLVIRPNDERVGSILTLSLQGFVPQQIADYLNQFCEVYINENLNFKNTTSANTIEFINKQLDDVIFSLEAAEMRLQNFRSDNQLIDIAKEGDFLFEELKELQSAEALFQLNNKYFNYLEEYLQGKSSYTELVSPSTMGIDDSQLNELVGKINELNFQLTNLEYSLQNDAPLIINIQTQIIALKQNLKENVRSLKNTNRLLMKETSSRIANFERQLKSLPFTERQLINIQREFNINNQIYTFLLEKRAEAGIAQASNSPDHYILDMARPENARKIKPDTSSNYSTALLLGILLPLVLIILIEYSNDKVVVKRDIENNTEVPIAGYIGHNGSSSDIPVFENPKSALSESFRSLRTNLKYILPKELGSKVISITSSISQEGKTFNAINLATIIAMSKKKTLLISLDLRKPKVHKIFNLKNDHGISTYLVGHSKLEEIIHKTNIENLEIAVSGPVPPNPSELVESENMQKLILDMRKKYDYIIIDNPPVAIVSDALLINDHIDLQLYVIRNGYSSKQIFQIINDLFKNKNVGSMGIIVNDVKTRGYYGYGYYSYYGYGYGYYQTHSYYSDDRNKIGLVNRLYNSFKRNKV
jgi:tyrosine-protein kinase Etk/Wzc